MQYYRTNAKWLQYSAPFRSLSISAAYITPFFLSKGLGLSKVFLLESIFSVALLLWELPSGYIADKLGRALSIKISAPIAAFGFIAYGFANGFWQFAACELVLALANGLLSGIDSALLVDSLKADGYEGETLRDEYAHTMQRVNALGYASTAAGVPVALLLVHYVNLSSTLVADGLLVALGAVFCMRLVEAPRSNGGLEAERLSAWRALKQLGANVEARWLVVLGAALATATQLGYWLSAPYYTALGIPVVWFGMLLAIRSAWKAWLSHRYTKQRQLERNLWVFVALVGVVFVAMASGWWWLLLVVLGHDVVQSLHAAPLNAMLNEHMHPEYRATLSSLVNLIRRLLFSVTGPLLGWLIEARSLRWGLVSAGAVMSSLACVALLRLRAYGTFRTP